MSNTQAFPEVRNEKEAKVLRKLLMNVVPLFQHRFSKQNENLLIKSVTLRCRLPAFKWHKENKYILTRSSVDNLPLLE